MSEQMTEDDTTWPRQCPHCGTGLQPHVTGFSPAATADATEGVLGAVVAEDFCPNPGCAAHPQNAPGSVGGDNGGA